MIKSRLMIRKFDRDLFCQLLLILFIAWLFHLSCHYPIYRGWDDATYILRNSYLNFSFSNILHWFMRPCVGCYLPLTMLSYMFDYNLWGMDSFGYHLQNMFWHIVATLAIYGCFRLFKIKPWITFFLCLIFAVHPQRVESVVWLSERKDVLCAAFYFLSIYFYVKNCDKQFSIIAFFFFTLSILSKSMAISLPVVLLLYEIYKRRSFSVKHYLAKLWPYFLLLLVFVPVSILAQGTTAHSHTQMLSLSRLYIVLHNIYWYCLQTILPTELNPIYPAVRFYNFVPSLLFFYVGVVLLLLVFLRKDRKVFVFCAIPLLLGYIITLLPVSGLIKLGSVDHADRYSYIPSVFIWFSVALLVSSLLYGNKLVSKNKRSLLLTSRFVFVVLVVYTSILFFINYRYQQKWKSLHSLFSYASSQVPVNSVALIALGDIELKRGNYGEVWIIAEKLKNKDDLIALFFEASVLFRLDKKSAVKLLLNIKPLLKNARSRGEGEFRYIAVLNMLRGYYESAGDISKAMEYNNEILSLPELDEATRVYCLRLKDRYLEMM